MKYLLIELDETNENHTKLLEILEEAKVILEKVELESDDIIDNNLPTIYFP